ncbi:hypothetical protein KP509_16G083100 [Ceratopteris richardii]|uniref:Uncharacterized protein n=1 Tax=Ceratopteris richardii TaxID=49495 RepID=A0A8T2T0G8_CERRI|nr:hypothetical protein KP509_16G083100 [Ceratopteris richardii]
MEIQKELDTSHSQKEFGQSSSTGRICPSIPAARAHEVAMASRRIWEFSEAPALGYVLTMIPDIIPFEESIMKVMLRTLGWTLL